MERISTTRCNSVLILICVVILCVLMAFFTKSGQIYHPPIETPSETTYISKIDTLFDTVYVYKEKLIPRHIETIRYDTITKDTVLEYNKQTYNDTLICASDTAIVGFITTGINVNVDSLSLTLRKSNYIKETTKIITVEKSHRWSIGPSVGIGYGLTSGRPDLFVGVGIQYSIK